VNHDFRQFRHQSTSAAIFAITVPDCRIDGCTLPHAGVEFVRSVVGQPNNASAQHVTG
jgi:hypothetical protein